MGRSKAGLELDGQTFLRRVVRALADGGCDPVFVVTAEGDESVAAEARRAGALVLANAEPGEGPITSLRIALGAIEDSIDAVVYLPVDHPLVLAETVSALLEAASTSGAKLTLPMRGAKRGHPAIFSRSLFAELLDPRLEGGARVVVHRHLDSAHLMQSSDAGVIADIDTPEAYRAAVAAGADA